MCQAFRSGVREWLWLRVSHEGPVKKLARAMESAERSASKRAYLHGCWLKASAPHHVALSRWLESRYNKVAHFSQSKLSQTEQGGSGKAFYVQSWTSRTIISATFYLLEESP